MKIKFVDDWGEWRERERVYFKFLSGTKDFQKIIEKARREIGLNEKNLPKNFETGELHSLTEKYAQDIVEIYGLGMFWNEPIRFLIVTGKMPSPGKGIAMSGWTPVFDPDNKMFIPPSTFSITVSEQMGYSSIKEFIDQNKNYIQTFLKKLPPKRSQMKKAEIKLDVFRLYERKVPVPKIAQFIVNKYDESFEEQVIWNWIRRMEQTLYGRRIK